MDYSKKQTELDIQKWVDSETKSYDTCGEYSYCCKCNKSESYPCACAYEKFYGTTTSTDSYQTKTTTRKTCAKKTSTCKSTTSKSKSTTCKSKTTSCKRTTKVAA